MDVNVSLRSLKIAYYIVLCLLPSSQADVIEYHTPQTNGLPNYTIQNLYADGIRIENSSSIAFQLKSKGFSYVLLQETQTDYKHNAVEIVLGSINNGGATISNKHNTPFETHYSENDFLSSSEYRHFWISWANSTVRVGKGNTTNQQEFLNWPYLNFDIKYISIGTAYWKDGYWRFTIMSHTSTPTPVTVSMKTSESRIYPDEKQARSLVVVYISVPCVVAIIIIAGAVLAFLLRRRKRNIRRQGPAVYSGHQSENERKHVSTVVKRGYNNHSLEIEKPLSYSKDNIEFKSLFSHNIDIPLTEAREYDYSTVNKKAGDIVAEGHGPEHDECYYAKVNSRAKDLVEDNYGYNHVNTNQQQKSNTQNYSTMVMGTDGLKADGNDTMYSHMENRGTKGQKTNVETENTYNKLNEIPNQNELFEENENAVNDHAGTDVRYPDINDPDDYSHLN